MESLHNIPGGMLIATGIGMVDSLIVWGIAMLFDVEILVSEAPGSDTLTGITIGPVFFVVVTASVAAGILLWLLRRFFADRALRIFQITATVVLVLSLAVPLGTDQSFAGQLALVAMHVLVGSAIIGTFTWVATKPGI